VYGLFGLMLFPFRNSKPWNLVGAGVALLAIGTLMSVLSYSEIKETRDNGVEAQQLKAAGDSLTTEQKEYITSWEEAVQKQKPEKIQKVIDNMHKGYLGVFKAKQPLNQFMQTTLVYELWVWDVLSFMLIGMALFKWGVFQNLRTRRFYLIMMVVGYAIGLSINYYESIIQIRSGFNPVVMKQAEMTYQIGRPLTTLGHVGLFMLFINSGILGWLQRSLSAVGKMALTNYLTHSIICGVVFLGFGFGLYGQLQRYELYYVVGSIWVFQLIASPIWMHHFHYGPAEWVWRSLAYKKRPPFKKAAIERDL
jgi:uncharacterized protein